MKHIPRNNASPWLLWDSHDWDLVKALDDPALIGRVLGRLAIYHNKNFTLDLKIMGSVTFATAAIDVIRTWVRSLSLGRTHLIAPSLVWILWRCLHQHWSIRSRNVDLRKLIITILRQLLQAPLFSRWLRQEDSVYEVINDRGGVSLITEIVLTVSEALDLPLQEIPQSRLLH